MDGRLRFVFWNRAAEALTGIPAERVLGKSLYEVFPEAVGTAAEQQYFEALRTRRPQTMTTQFAGERYEVTAHPQGGGLVVAARDVTARATTAPAARPTRHAAAKR
jgi:PAS domain S-box-containing protein